MADLNSHINEYVVKLKRRQIEGSFFTAKRAIEILRQVISHHRLSSSNASSILEVIKNVGSRLICANPTEFAIGNVVRRILHIIRDEEAALSLAAASSNSEGTSPQNDDEDSFNDDPHFSATAIAAANRNVLRAPSLHNLLESSPSIIRSEHYAISEQDTRNKSISWKLKHQIIEGVNELMEEIDNCVSQITEQALEHIHQNEVILTIGRSHTVLKFLLEAKKKRNFQVVAAEGSPRYKGQTLAQELASVGLQTTAITDSSMYAMMARVNMVIVSAHAIMANGGVIVPIGLYMAALAAKKHAVPFVVLAGIYKICPSYPHNLSTLLSEMRSPDEIFDFGEFSDCLDEEACGGANLTVVNPKFDYVPPELVSLLITDMGGHNPSYIYRLVAEYYSPEDVYL